MFHLLKTRKNAPTRVEPLRVLVAALLVCLPFAAAAGARQTSPAQPAPVVYDGDWWLSLGSWEQYGVVSGYQDCYTHEFRGPGAFNQEMQAYIDELNKYFLADPAHRKDTVVQALDNLLTFKAAASASTGTPAPANVYDGRFWFDADSAAELGFVEGYLACHTAKLKDSDGKFSKAASAYVTAINKAYNINDDTDDIDADKAPITIAAVLHKLKDDEAPPAKPAA